MKLGDFYHILNPSRVHAAAVRRYFRDNPISIHGWVDRSSHPTHLETIVEWAVQNGVRKLAVWGGDGTLNRVIHALHELDALTATTLLLMPTGTANDFARKAGIGPWKRSLSALLDGREKIRLYDVGVVETGSIHRLFINNSGFGRTPEALGRRRARPMKDIGGFTPKQLRLEWRHGAIREFEAFRAYFGIVFNAPFFNKGMHFAKDINPADGVLNAFFVPPAGKMSLMWRLAKSRLGGSLSNRATRRIDAEFLSLESESDLYLQADGEAVSADPVRHVRYSLISSALRLLQPA